MTTKSHDSSAHGDAYSRMQAELEEFRDMLVEASYLRAEPSGAGADGEWVSDPGGTARKTRPDG